MSLKVASTQVNTVIYFQKDTVLYPYVGLCMDCHVHVGKETEPIR